MRLEFPTGSITLPFTFNYPGGNTTDITIGSNGYVYLAAVTDNSYAACGGYFGSIVSFRDEAARIVAYAHDLDASVAGAGIFYEVGPANQFVRITWQNCPEWLPAGGGQNNNIQMTLNANGNVDLVFGSLRNSFAGNNALLGFTIGSGSPLGPQVDFSVLDFQTGDGQTPPILSMSARPVLGTTPDLITDNLSPDTLFQILVTGLAGTPTPLALAPFGMPNCNLHLSLPGIVGTLLTGRTANYFSVPWTIPNSTAFQDVQFFFQAAPLKAGLNPAGLITSNGVRASLGQ